MTRHFVTANLVLSHNDQAELVPLTVEFSYNWQDPWAVTFTFSAPNGRIPWIFGRDLLKDALDHPDTTTGMGDVQVLVKVETLQLNLSSPFGGALFHIPATDVSNFLEATETEVPHQAEMDVAGVIFDGELNSVLYSS
jgi:hypothetical protein